MPHSEREGRVRERNTFKRQAPNVKSRQKRKKVQRRRDPPQLNKGQLSQRHFVVLSVSSILKVSKVMIALTHILVLYNQVKVNKSVNLFMRSLISNPPPSRITY